MNINYAKGKFLAALCLSSDGPYIISLKEH